MDLDRVGSVLSLANSVDALECCPGERSGVQRDADLVEEIRDVALLAVFRLFLGNLGLLLEAIGVFDRAAQLPNPTLGELTGEVEVDCGRQRLAIPVTHE